MKCWKISYSQYYYPDPKQLRSTTGKTQKQIHKTSKHIAQRKMKSKTQQITIHDHTSNDDIGNRTQLKTVSHASPEMKWRWELHVVRLENTVGACTMICDPRRESRRPGR